MEYWFTSDTHFGHANIIKYCQRPFATADQMNNTLIRNWNSRVKADDQVFHVGDFCFYNTKDHGEGVRMVWTDWWKLLNGHKVLIRGNHDRNNSAKSPIQNMVIELGGLRIGLCHRPQAAIRELPLTGEGAVDLIICGHVHNSWKSCLYKQPMQVLPMINVSVEMWKYAPVSLSEIMAERSRLLREKHDMAAVVDFPEPVYPK
jgi:calcineurin-like phosphoesterase family protein